MSQPSPADITTIRVTKKVRDDLKKLADGRPLVVALQKLLSDARRSLKS